MPLPLLQLRSLRSVALALRQQLPLVKLQPLLPEAVLLPLLRRLLLVVVKRNSDGYYYAVMLHRPLVLVVLRLLLLLRGLRMAQSALRLPMVSLGFWLFSVLHFSKLRYLQFYGPYIYQTAKLVIR